MDRKKGEASWILDEELSEIKLSLDKARTMCIAVMKYFDCANPKEAAKAIEVEYNNMSEFPQISFDYINIALKTVVALVQLQEYRDVPPTAL